MNIHNSFGVACESVKNNVSILMALICFWAIALSSLFFSNYLYLDDLGRSLENYDKWGIGGRPLADLLSRFLYIGSRPFNVSPLNQFVSITILAFIAFLVALILKRRISWNVFWCFLPFGISPFLLENLSYSFDCIWMCLSILCACLSIYVITCTRRKILDLLVSSAFLVFSLCLYQSAMGVFFVVTAFVIYDRFVRDRPVFLLAAQCLFVLVLAMVFYKFILVYVELDPYAIEHADIFSISEILAGRVFENVTRVFLYLKHDWVWNPVGILSACLYACFLVYNSVKIAWAKNNVFIKLVFTIIVPPLALIVSYGLQLFLVKPTFDVRTFMAISIVIPMMLITLPEEFSSKWKFIVNIVLVMLIVQYSYLASTYGFLLKCQKEYEALIVHHLAFDIDSIHDTFDFKSIYIHGTIGKTPAINNTRNLYPMLDKLITVPLSGTWHWGIIQLRYFSKSLKNIDFIPTVDMSKSNILLHTAYYDIFSCGQTIVIVFSSLISS